MSLKEKIKQLSASKYFPLRLIYYSLKPCWWLLRLFKDSRYRSEMVTRLKYGKQYHQGSVFTVPERYPHLFAAAANYLGTVHKPAILSFGCSTGEEVFTLSKYLPGALITGVDINEWCIKQCKKKYPDNNFFFCHRLSPEFTAAGNFDAIFCMAVFQRTGNRLNKDNSIAMGFTFRQFEDEIMLLNDKLKPGGLLVIDNADFCFTDTLCAAHYTPLSFENNQAVRHRPLFDKNNKKIAETQDNYRVFVKNKQNSFGLSLSA